MQTGTLLDVMYKILRLFYPLKDDLFRLTAQENGVKVGTQLKCSSIILRPL